MKKFENKKIRFKWLLVAIFLLGGIFIFSDSLAYKIGKSKRSENITAHGVCKKVNGPNDKDYFIPTRTSAEWEAFRRHLPSGMSLGDCSVWLESNRHTSQDCTNSGGSAVDISYKGSTKKICRFNKASCPSGWSAYTDNGNTPAWTTTRGSSITLYSSGMSCGNGGCQTGEHNWSNKKVESCKAWTGKRGFNFTLEGIIGYSCKKDKEYSTEATITQIGCF